MSKDGFEISRRTALGAGVMMAAAGAAGPVLTTTAQADETGSGKMSPFARHQLGDFEIIAVLDGMSEVSEPQKTFGMNASADDFAAFSSDNFIPSDKYMNFYTPTLVKTGSELILFDTGNGSGGQPNAGNLVAGMAAAGYTPEDVSLVVLTHMHPDHVNGLMEDGKPVFSNASYVAGQTEYDFWNAQDAENNRVAKIVAEQVKPLADRMRFIKDGDDVVSGITGMAAAGHTPGHMVFHLESAGKRLLLTADTANHFVWSLGRPEWEVRFDMDKEAAAASRKKVFGMLASDKLPFIGYHMPFPSLGFVEPRDVGFRFVPETYQLEL